MGDELFICNRKDKCIGHCNHKVPHWKEESCSYPKCESEKVKCSCIPVSLHVTFTESFYRK